MEVPVYVPSAHIKYWKSNLREKLAGNPTLSSGCLLLYNSPSVIVSFS
uniref:Uncharacterized protein n=1 Tax=Arundo donax TaxID=35708 RepID=A0A0A8Z2W7_ARUDO